MTQNLEAIKRFLLAGAAIFTLVSKKTGERKTFRVRVSDDVTGGGPHGWFVDLLTGADNTNDYTYLCYLFIDRHNDLCLKQNKDGWGDEAFRSFGWLTHEINCYFSLDKHHFQSHFERFAEFHHCGNCARCGRLLTDPESIESGLGPICRGR